MRTAIPRKGDRGTPQVNNRLERGVLSKGFWTRSPPEDQMAQNKKKTCLKQK